MKRKILVVTLFSVCNYGTVLQAYATQEVLRQNNFDNKILNYTQKRLKLFNIINKSDCNNNNLKSKLYAITSIVVRCIPNIIIKSIFNAFVNEYLVLTDKKYSNYEEIINNLPVADTFITGSDQVWNSKYNQGIDYVYFLKFVPEKLNKISYAASIGMDDFIEAEKNEICSLLNNYNYIGVRELSAQRALQKLKISSSLVLDPTLLLNSKDWEKIEKKIKVNQKYLLVYILGRDKSILTYAKNIAKKKNLKIIKVGLDFIFSKGIYKNYQFATPNEFIYLFRNADYVITNSFHGVSFSINFNKQFVAISPKTYNTRLESILSIFNLDDRMVCPDECNLLTDIDYNKVNKTIYELRKQSMKFLISSINGNFVGDDDL